MLVPDVVYRPRTILEDALTSVVPSEAIPRALDAVARAQPPESLEGLQGVVVRVKEIQIHNNKRSGPLWGLFGHDAPADIYPIVLVANGESDSPVEFSLPHMFNDIRDGNRLPIAVPGIAVERNLTSVPAFLDIHILIMRSLQRQRDFATALDQALNSQEGKSIVDTLRTVVAGANAAAGAALNISASLLQVLLRYLGAEKDRQIFYGVGSLERQPDALGVDRTHVFEDPRLATAVVEVVGIR